jgi:hypothetical protein
MPYRKTYLIFIVLNCLAILLSGCETAKNSNGTTTENSTTLSAPAGIINYGQVLYENDGYAQNTCDATANLYYDVIGPKQKGTYPIVFGVTGTGFQGSANCADGNQPVYLHLNNLLYNFAKAGFVVVNIEYHGYKNNLYGNITYPKNGSWANATDATVQLDLMPAIKKFLSNNPKQYGADPAKGIVLFGSSSGAHDVYMIASVGIPNYKISASIGWSGLPDVSLAGSYPRSVFDKYMDTQPNTDVENFADPYHRAHSGMPPTYVANASNEFINPSNAFSYYEKLTSLNVTCWLRIPSTTAHAAGYANYIFSGSETTVPPVVKGESVLSDSIAFAQKYVSK